MAGKGDTQRPRNVSYDQWSRSYDTIFGVKKKNENNTKATAGDASSNERSMFRGGLQIKMGAADE